MGICVLHEESSHVNIYSTCFTGVFGMNIQYKILLNPIDMGDWRLEICESIFFQVSQYWLLFDFATLAIIASIQQLKYII